MSDTTFGRLPVEQQPPSKAPGGRSVPPNADLPAELAELAALLAEVVELAADRAVFPSRLQLIAELALEHDSVRGALAANRTGVVSPSQPQPDGTVMTTAAAASYLGLAGRDSARIWLAQRGIRPVGREPGPSGQNLYPAESVMPLQGQGRRQRPAYNPWRDAAGVSIPSGARVEQVLVDRAHGALASRLGNKRR